VTISPAALDDTVERVNITLPRRVLRRLDEEARAARVLLLHAFLHITAERHVADQTGAQSA